MVFIASPAFWRLREVSEFAHPAGTRFASQGQAPCYAGLRLTIRKVWRDLTRYALRGLENLRRGKASAAIHSRSTWLSAAGKLDWLSTPPLVKRGRAPFW